jgi:small subunit ribosomal protein S17
MTQEGGVAREGSVAEGGDGSKVRKVRKAFTGKVKSDKMDKTITVVVERLVRHPVYEKFVKRRSTLHAHDEKNEARIGDTVEVVSTRPLSKLKRFRLSKIVHRAPID